VGFNNAAFGAFALFANTSGGGNSAFGEGALGSNTGASNNDAFGFDTLGLNTTGAGNAAFGDGALKNLSSGNNNVAIGSGAGSSLNQAESNNIYIGNIGQTGESNTIRIGTLGPQTQTFIAGINESGFFGTPVVVSPSDQLGFMPSSRRYKQQIAHPPVRPGGRGGRANRTGSRRLR